MPFYVLLCNHSDPVNQRMREAKRSKKKERHRCYLCFIAAPHEWRHYIWRGHQTSPTVVSLKGRLPEIMQSTSTLSCGIIQIHSLFRHDFIKKPKSKFNRNRK